MKKINTKSITLLLVLILSSSTAFASLGSGQSIVCENDDAPSKGPNQCDHILVSRDADTKRLQLHVINGTSGNSCGLVTYIQDEDVKLDQSGTQISLEGHSTSSNGWNRTTHTFAKLNVNFKTGKGEITVKEGKWPEVDFMSGEKDQLSNCQLL